MDSDRFLAARISPGHLCTWTPSEIIEWDAVVILDRQTGKKSYGNCNDSSHPFEDVVLQIIRLIKQREHMESKVDNG